MLLSSNFKASLEDCTYLPNMFLGALVSYSMSQPTTVHCINSCLSFSPSHQQQLMWFRVKCLHNYCNLIFEAIVNFGDPLVLMCHHQVKMSIYPILWLMFLTWVSQHPLFVIWAFICITVITLNSPSLLLRSGNIDLSLK